MTTEGGSILSRIAPESVEEEFDRRGLDLLDDIQLFDAAVAIVGRPAVAEDSFSVHAPLELMARFILLPDVTPAAMRFARLQIVGLVAWYETHYQLLPTTEPRSSANARLDLVESITAGRATDALMAAERLIVARDVEAVIKTCAPQFLERLDVAAHSSIFLRLLRSMPPSIAPSALLLLRNFVSYLTRSRPVRATWPGTVAGAFGGTPSSEKGDEILRAVFDTPHVDRPDGGIRSIVESAEACHLPESVLDGRERTLSGQDLLEAACRAAPLSMLVEPVDHAKYGWTHALTLPEAVLSLADALDGPGRAAAMALEFAVAFRAAIGRRSVTVVDATEAASAIHVPADLLTGNGSPDETWKILVSAASVRADAHLVKYTLSARSRARLDPEFAGFYLASTIRLLEIWRREVPDARLGVDLAHRE